MGTTPGTNLWPVKRRTFIHDGRSVNQEAEESGLQHSLEEKTSHNE